MRYARVRASDLAELIALVYSTLDEKQLLILSEVKSRRDNITPLLLGLQERNNIPLSTLKDNAKVLQKMRLIEYGEGYATITKTGRLLLSFNANQ